MADAGTVMLASLYNVKRDEFCRYFSSMAADTPFHTRTRAHFFLGPVSFGECIRRVVIHRCRGVQLPEETLTTSLSTLA